MSMKGHNMNTVSKQTRLNLSQLSNGLIIMTRNASPDDKLLLTQVNAMLHELADAGQRLVSEFHEHGDELQTGENDAYGSDSAIGGMQTTLEALGMTFATPVDAVDELGDDTYKVIVHVETDSDVDIKELAKQLQAVYESANIAGFFNFEAMFPLSGFFLTFERSVADDGEILLERIANGTEINESNMCLTAGAQIAAELNDADLPDELKPILDGLNAGRFIVKGVKKLMPSVISLEI